MLQLFKPDKIILWGKFIKLFNRRTPQIWKNVMLVYGSGFIKKNGIYDSMVKVLADNGKNIVEDAGVEILKVSME